MPTARTARPHCRPRAAIVVRNLDFNKQPQALKAFCSRDCRTFYAGRITTSKHGKVTRKSLRIR